MSFKVALVITSVPSSESLAIMRSLADEAEAVQMITGSGNPDALQFRVAFWPSSIVTGCGLFVNRTGTRKK